MKLFRMLGIALLAVFAVGAAISTSAMATAEFKLLSTEAFPDTLSAKSGAGTLETVGGLSIKCTADTAKGELTSTKGGKATVTFTGCKEGTLACRSVVGTVKDAVETILIENQALVPAKIKAGTKGGIAFKLSTPLHITCGTAQDEVKGSVIGELNKVNEEVTAATLTMTQAKGVQKIVALSECVEATAPSCAELQADPLLAKLGVSFEQSGLETKEELTFGKMVTLTIV